MGTTDTVAGLAVVRVTAAAATATSRQSRRHIRGAMSIGRIMGDGDEDGDRDVDADDKGARRGDLSRSVDDPAGDSVLVRSGQYLSSVVPCINWLNWET